jgi:hypothetical protein
LSEPCSALDTPRLFQVEVAKRIGGETKIN